jgi:hypothetical protein
MKVLRAFANLRESGPLLRDGLESGNLRVLASLLGPAFRGLIAQNGREHPTTTLDGRVDVHFDWRYLRGQSDMAADMSKLYEAAKTSQWNATTDVDWSIDVDPERSQLLPDELLPVHELAVWRKLTAAEKRQQRHALLAWMLSQFLHGEQGALYAATQVTEAVPWLDGKLYGATQVMDEARHVEVFHRYLAGKLEKLYEIDENLYVVIDALMTDGRWDLKFLGMQIMVEGLALGAFGTLRQITDEPLLREVLRYVITDEARHVHYGVLALKEVYSKHLPERERRDREDWAFEMSLLLRNRFLAHEVYDEFYGHAMSRAQWDELLLASELMSLFRKTMFRRIIPNLKRIGLLSDRIRPHYEKLGLLDYETLPAAPDLTSRDLLEVSEPPRDASGG